MPGAQTMNDSKTCRVTCPNLMRRYRYIRQRRRMKSPPQARSRSKDVDRSTVRKAWKATDAADLLTKTRYVERTAVRVCVVPLHKVRGESLHLDSEIGVGRRTPVLHQRRRNLQRAVDWNRKPDAFPVGVDGGVDPNHLPRAAQHRAIGQGDWLMLESVPELQVGEHASIGIVALEQKDGTVLDPRKLPRSKHSRIQHIRFLGM